MVLVAFGSHTCGPLHACPRRSASRCITCRAYPPVRCSQSQQLPTIGVSDNIKPLNARASTLLSQSPPSGAWQGCARRLHSIAQGAGTALLVLCLTSAPDAAAAAAAESFQGMPRIVDGDTLVVDGNKVRLFGVDAPESKQSCRAADGSQYLCGQKVTDQLVAKLGPSAVRCEIMANDQYNRKVAVCRTDEFEINRWLVENGLAVAYREYSSNYVAAEDGARAAKRGIWAGAFDIPADWRKERKIEQLEKSLGRRGPTIDAGLGRSQSGRGFALRDSGGGSGSSGSSSASTDSSSNSTGSTGSVKGGSTNRNSTEGSKQGGSKGDASSPAAAHVVSGMQQGKPWDTKCPDLLIKGNISAGGEKIYHMPGSRSYVSTRINTQQGERYFCSEADAQAAGWRPAK